MSCAQSRPQKSRSRVSRGGGTLRRGLANAPFLTGRYPHLVALVPSLLTRECPLFGESGPCFEAGRLLHQRRDWINLPKCVGASRCSTGGSDHSSSSLANLVRPCRHCSCHRSYSPCWRRGSRTGGADHFRVHRPTRAFEWRRALWTVAQALSYGDLALATLNA